MEKQKTNGSTVIMEGAIVVGDVTLGEDCGVWFNTVIRGDVAPITIGNGTNVQECSVLHCTEGFPMAIGDGVTVGHNSILHGCTVGNNTLIGMGSTVMNGAVVGNNCVIGAGSLIPGGKVIPDGMMAFGRPAKVIRPLTEEEIEGNRQSRDTYMRLKELYR